MRQRENPRTLFFAVTSSVEGPRQAIDVYAKRLLHDRMNGMNVLLASPLYVAFID